MSVVFGFTTSPQGPAADVLALLTAAGIRWFDRRPKTVTPSDFPYVVVYDDPGVRYPDRYFGESHKDRWTFQIVCVSRTTTGLRDVTSRVKDALIDRSIDVWGGRISQPAAGPLLEDGPESDLRLSKTLTFQLTTTRSI